MIATVRGARRLEGELTVPGDKSISHRALILSAIALGRSRLNGLSPGEDVESTRKCLAALGAECDGRFMNGLGMHGLRPPPGPLDCGNSGTSMRLLAGLLAGQDFTVEITGDESLSRRPMDRVVEPLQRMGAQASWPPLRVGGGSGLTGIEYDMPVASAQVKSAILLAALYAEGSTAVVEPMSTRNHTELMLRAMGVEVVIEGARIEVGKTGLLEPLDIEVPGDFSSAAFWLVAAGLVPGSRVKLRSVGVNPTRTALAGALERCGVKIRRGADRVSDSEAVADLDVRSAEQLRPVDVPPDLAAAMIDELPVLAVAATRFPGRSVIRGAAELRVKESDRLAAVADGLTEMGADIEVTEDGWIIDGPRALEGARVSSRGDHRVAMAFAVAGLMAAGKTEIEGAECVDISYPGFFDDLEYLC